MAKIPTENPISALFGLFRDGFTFIQKRREKHQSDIFQIPVLGFKAICFGGEDAARTFYDPEKFVRKGAVPPPVQKTLTGKNAIHTTDGEVHHNRKEMFMSLMTAENITHLTDLLRQELNKALPQWESTTSIKLFRESQIVICKAICTWAGVPLTDEEAPKRSKDFVTMIDAFGSIGPRNLRGRAARYRSEKWMKGIIQDVRDGKINAPEGSALHKAAYHRNTLRDLFSLHLAAVELLNILRPTVAVSWYVAFGATALYNYPECRQKFITNENNYRDHFADEVRRYYPFAPFMGALVRKDFRWHDYAFPKGAMVLLDMYGTNHDPRLWEHPEQFIPERFTNRKIRPFDFLAQGGGDPHQGHRCPGEWITVETLKTILSFILQDTEFTVPKQDLSYNLSRMPTYPKSGFIMTNIRRKQPATAQVAEPAMPAAV